ncbi:uncharacterized protein B0P05DRAFT_610738 [Gilbertella persicaria]|nr:uncharacterized protein B0P05DRAFT_610738 [Gilbertella persicaria]KAI8083379.1 hypothetical protein B0P05DRAFT_610738 [Gilbertella persicaria]
MDIITCKKAICMLYCESYSKALAKELLGVEKVGLDICYRDNPANPLTYT